MARWRQLRHTMCFSRARRGQAVSCDLPGQASKQASKAKQSQNIPQKGQLHAIRARWPGENPGCVRTLHTI
jgi:hypothetical protein